VRETAYAEMRVAEAIALSGAGRREVTEPLRRAHRVATGLGPVPFRAEVEALARRPRVELGAGATGG
jgi:hypothetical protein